MEPTLEMMLLLIFGVPILALGLITYAVIKLIKLSRKPINAGSEQSGGTHKPKWLSILFISIAVVLAILLLL